MSDLNLRTSQEISRRKTALAEMMVEQRFENQPELSARFGPLGYSKCLEDAQYHLSYLAEAIANDSPALFCDYISWAKVLLEKYRVAASDLITNLQDVQDLLQRELPFEEGRLVEKYIGEGLNHLVASPSDIDSFIASDTPFDSMARTFVRLLLDGERNQANTMILEAVKNGTSIKDIYLKVFQPSQYEIGRLWQTNQISVAQEHYVTAATQLIMSQLYPYIFNRQKGPHTFVATCVSGELHEIGMRMVADFFEMEGWNTYYLGANMPIPGIVKALIDQRAQVLGISATITYHLPFVESLISAVQNDCQNVKIMVGGYPFNVDPDLWRKVRADGFATNAQQAVETATRLVAREIS